MSAIEAHATLPDDAHKDLRCCKQCKLVKTAQQFEDEGCDNCAWEGNESPDHVTAQFSGMVAVIDPKKSWAAKWLHVGRMLPGV